MINTHLDIYTILTLVNMFGFLYILTRERVKKTLTKLPFMFTLVILFSVVEGFISSATIGRSFSIESLSLGLLMALPFSILENRFEEYYLEVV